MKELRLLIKETISEWSDDKASRLAAALAYYVAFSLGPILVIAIAIIGMFYDRASAQTQIVNQISSVAGPNAGELVASMINASLDMGSNWLATILGLVALIFGATGVFGQLQDSLNTVWDVEVKPEMNLLRMLKKRFFSLTMVIGVGFLLLASLIISAALSALQNWSLGLFPGFEILMQIINLVVSILVITLLFALLFKFIPDAEIAWRDVWLGAAVTSILFTVGKFLIGLYLGNANAVNQFGAAGSLAVILLWVYYSAQISFLGAEFTQVYANRYGSQVTPDEDAMPLGSSQEPSKKEEY